jgi:hypothetical protein
VREGVLEVAENAIFGFDGFLHFLANLVDGGGVEATSLNELSKC